MQELFAINDTEAVCCSPGGRFHGWLFRKHADGSYVSVRQLGTVQPYPDDHPLAALFIHVTPKCEHDFKGWRQFEDGNGGEQVCSKCGIGAMSDSLRNGL